MTRAARCCAVRGRPAVIASLLALGVLAAAPIARAHAHSRARVLSDERTFTRTAHSLRRAVIRSRPARSARRVARMRLYTEDGSPELYLALRSRVRAHGREWVKVRIPMRPNGRAGWVPRDALGRWRLTHLLIVVDRRRLHMTLRRHGHRIWRAPVGVGAPGMPTPAGRFWIRERFAIADRRSGYYPYAFGTSDYSTLSEWPGGGIVGLHGTNEPKLIPGRPSHGCIRLPNNKVSQLWHLLPLGTPLHVI
jgi:hypothetical protein